MNIIHYQKIKDSIPANVRLVVVSKKRSEQDIMTLYAAGQRAFGENHALEIRAKHEALPKDIEWHFIGHLQTNKVKYIIPFVSLVHSIDSFKLLQEIDRQAKQHGRVVPCLLQFHIASETSKYGFSREECMDILASQAFAALQHARVRGVMGMASFTRDTLQISREFKQLYCIFQDLKKGYFKYAPDFTDISMGMSEDYPIAIQEGATLIRVGTAIFKE
ncbi:MAG: YggS family pyridoxal phosphate-dependent enzyme [Bacteroidales bacterium]|jgi:pyridoxal phosphate enzyme (YggS family)|nr:YggS family pyridoxal phosphate-dependent enzyme [Bacteroidales bacterium]